MCEGFTFNLPPELLAGLFGLAEHPHRFSCFNIAPTLLVPVISQLPDGQNHVAHLKWGLIPSWGKDSAIGNKMINARSETITGSQRSVKRLDTVDVWFPALVSMSERRRGRRNSHGTSG